MCCSVDWSEHPNDLAGTFPLMELAMPSMPVKPAPAAHVE